MERFNRAFWTRVVITLIGMVLVSPLSALATGPRVTTALFSVDKEEIHTTDFPPYISSEVIDSGFVGEIINTALSDAKVDAVLTIHPLKRMSKYYLLQENALAVVGRHLTFTDKMKSDLIFVPIMVLEEKYYYYKPKHPEGLKLNAETLKGLTYGAHHDEDVSRYAKIGTVVDEGSTVVLLQKLKSGEIDFISAPILTVKWLLKRYMPEDMEAFATTDDAGDDETLYMVFNRKHAEGKAAAAKFKAALAAMTKDGRYQKIVEKHLGGDHVKRYMRSLESFNGKSGQ